MRTTGVLLKCQIRIGPARNKTLSAARKSWCTELVGMVGKDWAVAWDWADGEAQDVYSFAKEEDATMFSLRWM